MKYRVTFPAVSLEVDAISPEGALDKACEEVMWIPHYDLQNVTIEALDTPREEDQHPMFEGGRRITLDDLKDKPPAE